MTAADRLAFYLSVVFFVLIVVLPFSVLLNHWMRERRHRRWIREMREIANCRCHACIVSKEIQ